jgi:hypothetical protein
VKVEPFIVFHISQTSEPIEEAPFPSHPITNKRFVTATGPPTVAPVSLDFLI